MNSQHPTVAKIAAQIEEINLQKEEVNLAVDYSKYKKNAEGIKRVIKQVTSFEYDMDPLENIPEIVAAINSLKQFEKKVASAK